MSVTLTSLKTATVEVMSDSVLLGNRKYINVLNNFNEIFETVSTYFDFFFKKSESSISLMCHIQSNIRLCLARKLKVY